VSGARYQGEWKRGREHGFGSWTSGNGESGSGGGAQYEGGFRDGLPHGEGRYVGPGGEMYQGEWRRGRQDGRGAWFGPDGTVYDGVWSAGRAIGGAVHRRAAGTAAPGVGGVLGKVLVGLHRPPVSGPMQRDPPEDVLARLADAELRADAAGLVRAAALGHFDSVAARVRAGCDVDQGIPLADVVHEPWYAGKAKGVAGTAAKHQLAGSPLGYNFEGEAAASMTSAAEAELGPVEAVCIAVEHLCSNHPEAWAEWVGHSFDVGHLGSSESLAQTLSYNSKSDVTGALGGAAKTDCKDHAQKANIQSSASERVQIRALVRVLKTLERAGANAGPAAVSCVLHGRAAAIQILADSFPPGKNHT
jgi:hypothetical protein